MIFNFNLLYSTIEEENNVREALAASPKSPKIDHLKVYVQYLLERCINEFAKEDLKNSLEACLPYMQLYRKYEEKDQLELNKASISDYLNLIKEGKVFHNIHSTIERWKKEELMGIAIEKTKVEEVINIFKVRKNSLLTFIPKFTQDASKIIALVKEIEAFYSLQEKLVLESYSTVQESVNLKQKEFIQTLINNTIDGILAFDKDFKVTLWSPSLEKNTGIAAIEVLHKNIFDIFPSYKDREEVRKINRVFKGEKVKLKNIAYGFKEGFFEANLVPLLNIKNIVVGGICIFSDISDRKIVEEKLKEREHFIQEISDSNPNLIYVIDLQQQKISYVNNSVYQLLGYNKEEIKEMSIHSFLTLVHPFDRERANEHIMELLAGEDKQVQEIQYRIKDKFGQWHWLHAYNVVFRKDKNGRVTQVFGTSMDITERKEIEEILIESEKFISKIAISTPDIITVFDITNKRSVYINHLYIESLGYTQKELNLLGNRIFDTLVHPEDHFYLKSYAERILKAEEDDIFELEFRIKHKLGGWRWFSTKTKLFRRDNQGNPWQYLTFASDISEKKKVEEELKESQLFINQIATSTPTTIFVYDLIQKEKIYSNKPLTNIFGHNEEKTNIHFIVDNLVHPEDQSSLRTSFNCLENALDGEVIEAEFRVKRLNDEWKWIYIRCTIFKRTSDGKPWQMLGTALDISERKAAEETLIRLNNELETRVQDRTKELKETASKFQKSQLQLKMITDAVPALIAYIDASEHCIFINEEYKKWHGKGNHKLVGEQLKNLLGESNYAKVHPYVLKTLKGKSVNFHTEIVKNNNEQRYINAKYIPDFNDHGVVKGFVSLTIDVTESIKAQEALKNSEERLSFLAESIPQMVWTSNCEGKFDYCNLGWLEYTGLSMEETQGEGWVKALHIDDLEASALAWKHSIDTGTIYELENRFKRASDGMYRWHLSRAFPFKDKNGVILKWFGTCTDIHDQKMSQVTLAKAKEQLSKINSELSSKNKELIRINTDLDNFIYTASHDLKAPISNIEGLVQELFADILPSANNELIKEMLNSSILRFKNTLKDLTEITKLQKEEAEVSIVNFHSVLTEIKFSIKDLIDKFQPTIFEDLNIAEIKFSAKNLRSIIYNLVSNAIKYSSPRRKAKVTVATYREENYTVLQISDNGLGINDDSHDKIFGMFKRLHDHVEGTGVGLYIVKRIIDNAGGRIEVESKIDKGTTFKVFLKS